MIATSADYSRILDTYGFVRRKLTKSQVAVLMYHRVSPKQDSWSLKSISPKCFEKQIRYFRQNYEIFSLDILVEYMKQGKPLPEKSVVITFDDGYKDNYRYAYPILKKYHVPTTIFLTTGHIDTGNLFWWDKVSYIIHHTDLDQINLTGMGTFFLRSEREKSRSSSLIIDKLKKVPEETKYILINNLLAQTGVEILNNLGEDLILSWKEIKEMSNFGITFGAHTVSHPILTNLSLDQAKHEIVQSKRDIEEMIGCHVTSFSFPNGDLNSDIVKLVRESGFACSVAVLPNKLVDSGDSLYMISRIMADEDFSKSKVVLCGLWGDLKKLHYW